MDYLELKREIESAEEEDEFADNHHVGSMLLNLSKKSQNHSLKFMMGFPPDDQSGTCISLGQTFRSFSEVSEAVRNYEFENGVHLTAKYFRRIAANPKPSNKEDYMLTVEERKRFVYRWVDFCCTFFDGRIISPEEGDKVPVPGPALGFSAKECPMRIRFQLRSKEKDLIVSTCKEVHEHDDPTLPIPTANEPCSVMPSQISPTAKIKLNMESNINTDEMKCNKVKRPIPPLNALPSTSSHVRDSIPPTDNVRISSSTTKMVRNWMPKPPPLRRGPMQEGSSSGERIRSQYSKPPPMASTPPPTVTGLSARTVITNLYNYLRQTKTEGPEPDGIGFVSDNPNLIKMTAKLSGVDEKIVFQIIHPNRVRVPGTTGSAMIRGNQIQPQLKNNLPTIKRPMAVGMVAYKPSQNIFRRNVLHSTSAKRPASDRYVPAEQQRARTNQRSYSQEDNDEPFTLPLEVIIKSEPTDYMNGNEDEDEDAELGNGKDFEESSFDVNAACSTR